MGIMKASKVFIRKKIGKKWRIVLVEGFVKEIK